MALLFLATSMFLLLIAAIYIVYIFSYRSRHIHYFHYEANKTITYITLLLFTIQLLSTAIEKITGVEIKTSTLDNITTSIITGIIASAFLFILTYIHTQKEEEHNLKLLLEKIARCNFLAKRMKERLYDIKKKEELNEKITLFKQEVFTAYQIASACKVSFIPVIAFADSFIQKLEITELRNVTRNFFIEINALHDFLYPERWTTEKILCMPEYKDIDKIKKAYKEIYDKISCSSPSIPPTDSIPQAHKKQSSKDGAPLCQKPNRAETGGNLSARIPRSRSRRTTHELSKKKSNYHRSPVRRMRRTRQ